MPNPVVHFEIITKDPNALADFYKQAFEWQIDTKNPGPGAGDVSVYLMARPDGTTEPATGINGGIGGAPEGYQGHVSFYIGVDDVGAALAKVEKLGARRMMGPERVPDGPVIGLFEDPQGHTIGLVEIEAAS